MASAHERRPTAAKSRPPGPGGPLRPRTPARRPAHLVAVVVLDGSPILDSAIPLSVFGADVPGACVHRYRLLVCSAEPGPLTATAGLRLAVPHGMDAIDAAGTVVVPAWRAPGEQPPACLLAALARAHREGARIVGLGTGTFVLAAAGLLDHRPATTHWLHAPVLARNHPRVRVDPRALYVDDGDILTSGGTTAGIDLCLHLVRRDHGPDVAAALARRLAIPARRADSQAGFMGLPAADDPRDAPLAAALRWALDHLAGDIDLDALAARAYMGRRTFDRRFRALTGSTPLQWLLTQRAIHAQRLLERPDLPLEAVARQSGFRTVAALRTNFRKVFGVSPGTYRESCRPAAATARLTSLPSPTSGGDFAAARRPA